MEKCVHNCGECPYFEPFVQEEEAGVGLVTKGRCHYHNEDEIWETKTPCSHVEGKSIDDLCEEAFR